MLGWEFYPVFAGGMGVVTSEIAHGLTDANIGVHFVIPKLPKKIQIPNIKITSAHDYIVDNTTKSNYSKLQKTHIETNFIPYGKSHDRIDQVYTYDNQHKNDLKKSANTPINSTKIYHEDIIREIKIFEDKTLEIALNSNFDLIHAHEWLTFRAAIRAKEITGKPVVLHVHATEIDRSGDNPDMLVFNIEKECLEKADYVVAISQKSKADIMHHYRIDPNKIIVIHNSSNFSQPHNRSILQKTDKIVLFLGRITMQKGPEYFIHAAAKVLKYLPHTIFVMAGDGNMLTQCIDLVNDLNIEKNFIFTGWISGEQKERLYASADLFVMPSVSEPFGIVALEAVKSGTPVIVSKNSGAAEIIQNSITVDFWDINQIANAIHGVLKYNSLHDTLIQNQQRDVFTQNWNHQIDTLITVYEKAIEENKYAE